ncbi:MAG: hypothetical protein IJQ18_04890 [Paludibacteraceae bacterium]|nr:hypothetical protein [Paludibacteraceae bacterium]
MKSVKSILIATTLICASVASGLSAQQTAQPASQYEFRVAVDDSVMINRECVEYSTGERPSVWVWDKVHTVRQLGTKKYPDGVLLMNIYSWICDTCLVPVTPHAEEPVKQEEIGQTAPKATETKTAVKEEPVEQVAQQPAEKPAEPVAEQPAEEPAAQPVPVTEKVAVQHTPDDSIKSQQHFRHSYDRFTIGIRGGVASLLHNADNGKWICGGDAVLDLQYAHYWTKDGRPVDLGLIVGLGLGYTQSSLSANPNADTTITDSDGMKVDYLIRADEVKEHDGQLQLEVPLMFSLIHENGLFFNFGPKFMLPVYTPYRQTLTKNDNTEVSAYLPDLGVTFINDEIMGKLSDGNYEQRGSDYKNRFTINVMLTAEIGYEWILKSGNSLGLGAFANYSVFNSFKNDPKNKSLVELTTQPSNTSEAAFMVNPATQTYAKGLGFFDAGIKIAYHFNFPKKQKKNYQVEKLK